MLFHTTVTMSLLQWVKNPEIINLIVKMTSRHEMPGACFCMCREVKMYD